MSDDLMSLREGEADLYDYGEAGYFCNVCKKKAPAHHAARGQHTRMHVRKGEAKIVTDRYSWRDVPVITEPEAPAVSSGEAKE